jgi:LCP family protein required for cell wall assembly
MAKNDVKKIKKNPKRMPAAGIVLIGIQLIASIGFCLYIYNYNILPLKYLAALGGVLALLFLIVFLFFIPKRKKTWKHAVGFAVGIITIALIGAALYYTETTFEYLRNMNDNNTTDSFSVIVMKESGINTLDDLSDIDETSLIGLRDLVDTDGTQSAYDAFSEESGMSFGTKAYTLPEDLKEALYEGEVEMILVDQDALDAITTAYPAFSQETTTIFTYEVEKTSETAASVTTTPFTVYIRGLDSRNESYEYGNSDVNIIATINPVTKQILLTSIPRDYYVPLYGNTDKMDKLTHSGAYGLDCSIETLESLLEINIDYYVIVNFDSVVNIVDALGGVDVVSEYEFNTSTSDRTGISYHIDEGVNTLDGEAALTFARERHMLPEGDKDRGRNQEALITAIIEKLESPAILSNYTAVLEAITENVHMDIPTDMITSFIQMQLSDTSEWHILSISLDGSSAYKTTYSYPTQELYVMLPYYDTVDAAIEQNDNVVDPGPYWKETIKSSDVFDDLDAESAWAEN